MKNIAALQIILLNVIIIHRISPADVEDMYQNMSLEELKIYQQNCTQQNIADQANWEKEKQVETCCGICWSFIIPTMLCGYGGYRFNEDIGIPIGTFVGTYAGSKIASAFLNWYQPDSNKKMIAVNKIIAAKQKEKTD